MEAKVFKVIAGVDDDGQVFTKSSRKAKRKLCPADAAAKGNNTTVENGCFFRSSHRNMSLSRLRISAEAGRFGASDRKPRTSTAGTPSAACPMNSDAAEASSSAVAISVTLSLRSKRSLAP